MFWLGVWTFLAISRPMPAAGSSPAPAPVEDVSSLAQLGERYRAAGDAAGLAIVEKKLAGVKTGKYEALLALGRLLHLEARESEAAATLEQALALKRDSVIARIDLGAVYNGLGQFGKAARVLEQAFKQRPRDYEVAVDLGKCYLALGRPDRAEKAFAQAKRINGKSAVVYIESGQAYLRAGAYAQAKREFDGLIAVDSASPAGYFNRGIYYDALQQPHEAEEGYRQALRALEASPHPDANEMADVFYRLGLSLQNQGRFSEAEAVFRQGLEKAGRNAHWRTVFLGSLGMLAKAQGKSAEAERSYKDAVAACEAGPECSRREWAAAAFNLGDYYIAQGRPAEAEALAERVGKACNGLAVNEDSLHMVEQLAELYGKVGNSAKAEALWRWMLAAGRETPLQKRMGPVLLALARLCAGQGRWAEAEGFYRRASELFKENGDRVSATAALHGLVAAYDKTGKAREAAAALGQAEAMSPEDVGRLLELGTRYLAGGDAGGLAGVEKKLAGLAARPEALAALGRLLNSEGKYAEAVAALEQAFKQRPRDYEVAVNLGKSYLALGRPDQAHEAFTQAKGINSQSAAAYIELGQAYLRAGAYAQAKREFECLIAVDSVSPAGYFNLGVSYDALQQPHEAEGSYRQALRALEASPHPDANEMDDASHRLGLNLQKQGRSSEAEAVFRQGLEKAGGSAPRRAGFLQYLGGLAVAGGKPVEAERSYKEALAACEAGPECSRREWAAAAFNLGDYYIAQGRPAEAEALAERIGKVCNGLAVNEDRLNMAARLAELYGKVGNSAKAEALGRWMLAAGRETPLQKRMGPVLLALARLCAGQGRWAEAEGFYRRASELFKENGDRVSAAAALHGLVSAYDKTGKARDAAAALGQAEAMSPEDAGRLLEFGRRYLAMGDAVGLAGVEKKLEGLGADRPEALVALGRLLSSEGKYAEAAAALEQAFKQRPRDYEVAVNLGKSYLALGRPDQAHEAFTQAKGINSQSAAAYIELGQAYLRAGAYAQAKREFEGLIAVDSVSPAGYFNLGVSYDALQQPHEAEGSYRQALRALEASPHPDANEMDDASHRLGLNLQKQGRFSEAEAVFRQGLEKAGGSAPRRAGFLQYLGGLAVAGGKPVEAERSFKEAVAACEAGPECSRREWAAAAVTLGHYYIAQGRPAEAEALAERVGKACNGLAVNEDSLNMVAQLADLYGEAGNSAKAETLWRWALASGQEAPLQKRMGPVFLAFARFCLKQGRWAEAEEFYRRASELFKENGDKSSTAAALHGLAAVYDKAGKGREAAAALGQAQAMSPEDAGRLLELGEHHLAEGDAAGLAGVEQKLAGLGADHPEALAALGRLLNFERKYAEAAAALEQAFKQRPRDYEVAVNLGKIYLALGRPDRAHQVFAQAKEINSQSAAAYIEPGQAYLQAGAYEQAKREFEGLVAVDSANPFGYFYLGSLYDALQQPHEAEGSYRQALQRLEAVPPANPSQLGETLAHLGNNLQQQGRFSEAEAVFHQGLETAGGSAPRRMDFLQCLGGLAVAEGKLVEAERFYKEAMVACESRMGCTRKDKGDAAGRLAIFYAGQGRKREAEPLAERAEKEYQGLPMDECIASFWRLVDLYGMLDQSFRAETILRRIAAVPGLLPTNMRGRAEMILADRYAAQGRWAEAEDFYRRASELFKENGDRVSAAAALHGLVAAYDKVGKGREAAAALKQEQSMAPEYAGRLLILGKRYLVGGDAAGLAEVEKKLRGLVAARPETLAALGRLLNLEGKHAEAAAVLERVLALKTDDFETLRELGQTYSELGQCEKAARIRDKVLKGRSADYGLTAALATCYRGLGRPDDFKPDNYDVEGELGCENMQAGRGLEGLIAVGTASPFGYYHLGGRFDEHKHPHEAEACYRGEVARLTANPLSNPSDSAAALQRLGSLLYEQGKSTEAETAFRQGLEKAGRRAEWRSVFLWSLGDASSAQSKPAQAEESYRAAVAACEPGPGCSRAARGFALSKLGLFYAEQGRKPEAEDLAGRLGKACDGVPIDDESIEVFSRLSDLYRKLGRSSQAQALLQRMLAARGNLSVRWGLGRAEKDLAEIYQTQGQWAESEELYLEAIETLKRDGDAGASAGALDGLAAVYEKEGRGAEAAAARRQAQVIRGRRGEL